LLRLSSIDMFGNRCPPISILGTYLPISILGTYLPEEGAIAACVLGKILAIALLLLRFREIGSDGLTLARALTKTTLEGI